MRTRDDAVTPAKQEVRWAWTLEVVRFMYDKPDATLAIVAKHFERSNSWLDTMRKDPMWETAWYQVGREKLAPAVPKAVREILAALDRGDAAATNLAVKILENSGLLRSEADMGASSTNGLADYIQVEYLPPPPEPDFKLLIAEEELEHGITRVQEPVGSLEDD